MIKQLKNLRVTINSILGGFSSTFHLSKEDEYLSALAIDPEVEYGATEKILGAIFPTASTLISGGLEGLKQAPAWITGSQTSTGVFVYGANGTLFTYSNVLAPQDNETAGIITTSGKGNGMVAAGDYLYLATGTGVTRFGLLSTTQPTALTTFWTTANTGEGLGLTALTDTTYPGTLDIGNSVAYPNHVMHLHNDGYIYVADYVSGQGMIHSFYSGASTTSLTATYSDLLLPPGLYPTDIKSYGTDLAILCTPAGNFTAGSVPRQGNCALILWDTTSNNFYRSVTINEPVATALANKNGELYIFAGNIDRHVKVLKYLGGFGFQPVVDLNEGSPPPAGAVDTLGNMIAWGGWGGTGASTYFANVYTYGYRSLPGNALNSIMRISHTDGTYAYHRISALRFVLNSSGYPVVGWHTDTNGAGYKYGLDYAGTGALTSKFKTRVFNIGTQYNIKRIRIPLLDYVSADTVITPTVFMDGGVAADGSALTQALPVINRDNYPNQERLIDYTDLAIGGMRNFYIQFVWSSTATVGIGPNVTIDLDLYD